MRVNYCDYTGKQFSFDGDLLIKTKSPGILHRSGIYQASFALYWSGKKIPKLYAAVVLPNNSRETEWNTSTHVFSDYDLDGIFKCLDDLDVMQHICLPFHWTGSCAMAEYQLEGPVRIRLDILQGLVSFMEECLNGTRKLPL